jgi:small subunit ribosomal protein S5
MPKTKKPRSNRKKRDSKYDEEVITVDRISRMTAGGRRMRFRAVMVLGNKIDEIGIGVAKAADVSQAINKAKIKAEKSVFKVPIIEGTIPHQIKVSFSGAEIMLKPAAPGTGIIAGGVVRKAIELAGIENILSKSFGSQNKINNLKATIKALKKLSESYKDQKDINNENK